MTRLTFAVARSLRVGCSAHRKLSTDRGTWSRIAQVRCIGSDAILDKLTVDVSAEDAAERVAAAFEGPGFFYATGHGVSEELMDRARGLAKDFFAMPQSSKEACVFPPALGYRDQRKISLDPESQAKPDTRESFLFSASEHSSCWSAMEGESVSKRLPPDFRVTLTDYWEQVQSLSKQILRLSSAGLKVEPDLFDNAGWFDQPMSLMSLLRYDETPSQEEKGTFGCGAHCDFGAVTVLQQDPEVEGLQISLNKHAPREDMTWLPIPPRRGTFVVSCGLALENWSNGRFGANLHRVVSTSGRERISVPFFLQPNATCRVSPLPACVPDGEIPRFEPVLFGDYIKSRFVAIGRTASSS